MHSVLLMAKMFLCGYLVDLEIIGYEVLPLMFDEKFDRENSLVLITTRFSLMVDQVPSLCTSERPYAMLKEVHS